VICPHCGKAIQYNVPEAKKKEALKLSKQGYSLRDIEAMTGVSFSTVSRLIRSEKKSAKRKGNE
jgi:transposase